MTLPSVSGLQVQAIVVQKTSHSPTEAVQQINPFPILNTTDLSELCRLCWRTQCPVIWFPFQKKNPTACWWYCMCPVSMVTHLDHWYEAPRWPSHETRARALSNPFLSKCDFLLIIISCFELLRTASVSHYGLWGGGGVARWHPVTLSPAPPAAAAPLGAHTCAQARRWGTSRGMITHLCYRLVREHRWQPPKWVPRSPTARWSGADKARPQASALEFTL